MANSVQPAADNRTAVTLKAIAMSAAKGASGISYFGTTDGFPPREPGGGITGVAPLAGGCTAIPGSTLGGLIVPFCFDR